MNRLIKLNNYFKIVVQSNILLEKYVNNGYNKDKLVIIEPIAYKYNFNIPERTNNEIRLIYCGTLRDEKIL